MAADVITAPDRRDQRSLSALPLARASLHADPGTLSTEKNSHCVQFQHGAA